MSEAIKYLKLFMEQTGKDQPELSKLLGSRSRSAEVLNGTRKLSLSMIKKLTREWGADANFLINQ